MKPRSTLLLLTLIATVQFFDRALMVVVMEPLRHEFGLSDAQLGLLSGLSYAAAFALAGIPLGWLADRLNRQRLLTALLLGWSALVALAGQAGGFVTLVAARIGVGAMDAGGQPCSVSMIADLYRRERRAGAVAVFYAGVPLGMAGGFMGGALVTAHWGWRSGFLVAAALGLLLGLLLAVAVREPRRGASEPGAPAPAAAPALGQALAFMRGQPSLLLLMAASVLVTVSSSAMMSWIGSLLIRSHGLDLPTVGLLTAVCMGGFGALGTLAFGWASDRLGARDMRWQFRLMAGAALGVAVLGTGVALLPTVAGVAVALALFAACVAGLNGPTYALSQSLVQPRMRGLSMSVLVVGLNLIGVGVGPTLAGLLSDLFAARFGDASVRWAMVCVLMAGAPAALLFWRAAATVRADLARVDPSR